MNKRVNTNSKYVKGEGSRAKNLKDELIPLCNRTTNTTTEELKKTRQKFLQNNSCFKVAPKLSKCRECRLSKYSSLKNIPKNKEPSFCRFYGFRKLRYNRNEKLVVAGFSDPNEDPLENDLKLWLPSPENPPPDLDLETSIFILKHIGDCFCYLLLQEKEAQKENISNDTAIAWKQVLKGVREMCDVCDTTIFNFHWICGNCGFAVCLDCYKSKKDGTTKNWLKGVQGRDDFNWFLCSNQRSHEQEKLILTQMITSNSLFKLGTLVHEIRKLWGIRQKCGCAISEEDFKTSNNAQKKVIKSILANKIKNKEKTESFNEGEVINKKCVLTRLREVSVMNQEEIEATSPVPYNLRLDLLREVISDFEEDNVAKTDESFPRIMTLTTSKLTYPDTPHSWLCDGKLLLLTNPCFTENYKIFQDQWKRGQPVMISNVCQYLDKDLWHPEAFIRDFGEKTNDLVNCINGKIVKNKEMRKFWEGFEHVTKREKDETGNPMVLKLKDWPSGDDFAEILPRRFADLMKALPLSDYTLRNGKLNLASHLPNCFAVPDLGPKMYNAYGSALHPTKGTTNLHLDISDALNLMVYIGVPKDSNNKEIKEAYQAIDEAGCDFLTQRRIRENGNMPGALWHIYNAQDADKIRDLLNRVEVENGGILKPKEDPIHDQSFYLDKALRERLYIQYGVSGYTIVQCLGDAIFIPAGAPHQVRNLHSCIKIAEDFVSPENVSHCYSLTQEFRKLSDTHTNHEDKLQIKNIIYHAVKDSVATLTAMSNIYSLDV